MTILHPLNVTMTSVSVPVRDSHCSVLGVLLLASMTAVKNFDHQISTVQQEIFARRKFFFSCIKDCIADMVTFTALVKILGCVYCSGNQIQYAIVIDPAEKPRK